MRQLKIIVSSIFLVAIVVIGVSAWLSRHVDKDQEFTTVNEDEFLKTVEELLAQGDRPSAEEALEIIHEYEDSMLTPSKTGKRWADFFLTVCMRLDNYKLLVGFYEVSPQSFEGREDAILLVARTYIALKRAHDYQQLRTSWQGKVSKHDDWFLLDGGKLVVEGKKEEAANWLSSKTLEGDRETARLIRLSLIFLMSDPNRSWEHLTEAYQKDPDNPEIRSLRGRLLESYGKNPLALSEYVAAIAEDPGSARLRDQLAEFYRRQHKYGLALRTWSDALDNPTSDYIWAKALFWNKVVHPVNFDWTDHSPPEGPLEPMVSHLVTLDADVFWDTDAWEDLPNATHYLGTHQTTFWLRLIQHIKDGEESQAFELLNLGPFSARSWDPDLELALKRILHYRNTGQLAFATPPALLKGDKHSFFKALDHFTSPEDSSSQRSALPKELNKLMNSEEAFTAAFLAAGWLEAALQLHNIPVIPDDYPDWLAYGLTQAYRSNRSNMEALDFASKQKPTPSLSILVAEVLIASGSPEAAIEQLQRFTEEDSAVGFRAAWLLSLIHIDRYEFNQAKKVIEGQPRLADTTVGQETIARIALLEGKNKLADKLYSQIENESSEAKSYLARKAFAQKNWHRARKLTEDLLEKHPNNRLLRKNLKLIVEKQNTDE